jgi:hypothetical protein
MPIDFAQIHALIDAVDKRGKPPTVGKNCRCKSSFSAICDNGDACCSLRNSSIDAIQPLLTRIGGAPLGLVRFLLDCVAAERARLRATDKEINLAGQPLG